MMKPAKDCKQPGAWPFGNPYQGNAPEVLPEPEPVDKQIDAELEATIAMTDAQNDEAVEVPVLEVGGEVVLKELGICTISKITEKYVTVQPLEGKAVKMTPACLANALAAVCEEPEGEDTGEEGQTNE